MANAMLYYRTPSTTSIIVPNPSSLPDAQKLLFTPPEDIASGIDESHSNNIVRKIPPKPRGRKLIQTDEGFKEKIMTLHGNFLVESNFDPDKLDDFIIRAQSDDFHTFGVFGIVYPNGPAFLTKDATDQQGFMIQSKTGKHIGITKEIFDFSVTISFGGTIT